MCLTLEPLYCSSHATAVGSIRFINFVDSGYPSCHESSRHTIICLIELVILFLNTLANKGKKLCLPNDRIQSIFHITIILVQTPFIHFLGSSLIQWMIVRINRREEPKQDLQVRLGEAILCLGEEVRLGEALLRLGGPESAETLGSGLLRRSDLHLGGAPCLGVHSNA